MISDCAIKVYADYLGYCRKHRKPHASFHTFLASVLSQNTGAILMAGLGHIGFMGMQRKAAEDTSPTPASNMQIYRLYQHFCALQKIEPLSLREVERRLRAEQVIMFIDSQPPVWLSSEQAQEKEENHAG